MSVSSLKFPAHKCSLRLAHNYHLDDYRTVEELDRHRADFSPIDWISEEQKAKAFSTNEFWELTWYPETPVGFHQMAACDLDVLLEVATNVGAK